MTVYCPHCGAETDADDKFCVVCGELVHATGTCARCGEVVPIAAAYCPKCGISFLDHPEMCIQRIHAMEESEFTNDLAEKDSDSETGIEDDKEGPRLLRLSGLFHRSHARRGEPISLQEDISCGESETECEDRCEQSKPHARWFRFGRKRGAQDVIEPQADNEGLEADVRVEDAVNAGGGTFEEAKAAADGDDSDAVEQGHNQGSESMGDKNQREKSGAGFFSRMLQKFKKKRVRRSKGDRDDFEENLVTEPSVVEEDNGSHSLKKHKPKVGKGAKLDDNERAAMEAFEAKVNQDGYYNDVRPADFGEDDDERPDVDIKQIIAMIVIISIVCAIIVKLQSML